MDMRAAARLATLGVMPALVAGIHVLQPMPQKEDVDGRNKSGHDEI
jgi:hypothetical protein